MAKRARVADALRTGVLAGGFERRCLVLEPGVERPTSAGEWAGALVLVEGGTLEVECLAGGRERFRPGSLLALGWLPLRALRNGGSSPIRITAVRRRRLPPGAPAANREPG